MTVLARRAGGSPKSIAQDHRLSVPYRTLRRVRTPYAACARKRRAKRGTCSGTPFELAAALRPARPCLGVRTSLRAERFSDVRLLLPPPSLCRRTPLAARSSNFHH